MEIYVISGLERDSGFVEVIKLCLSIKDAEEYCKKQLKKKDNPYKEVNWQKAELEDEK